MSGKLVELIVELREEEALNEAKGLLAAGVGPQVILKSCSAAMKIVGKRFEEKKYYLPDLLMSGEIMRQVSAQIQSGISGNRESVPAKKRGLVVLGTVEGDLHDIGKNIVKFLLEANGFGVIDLGVNVSPDKFVEATRNEMVQVVGLSALLTVAFESMKKTIEAIEDAGLREKVKIIIGGAPVDETIANYVNADRFAMDAQEGVKILQQWLPET